MILTVRTVRKIRPRVIRPVGNFAPIADINITPLIDMMLVLLVILIVSIPMATHKVPLDLPRPSPTWAPPPPAHLLAIDPAGALAWDGQPLAADALPGRLAALNADPARPVLQLAPDAEARYERVDQIFALIRRAGVTRLGFVGNQRFAAMMD